MRKRIFAIILLAAVIVSLLGCGDSKMRALTAEDLMLGVRGDKPEALEDLSDGSQAVTDFGLRLFQSSMKPGENSLVSPLSVISALAMTANGAEGETLAQMEEVLGMSTEDLNVYLYSYMNELEDKDDNTLSLANSIWFKDDEDLTVEESFLKTNGSYYDASVYKAAFDESTINDINRWVSDHTGRIIPEILNQIPENAIMYLVNALAFQGQWHETYKDYQVHDGTFTTEDGEKQAVELMYSGEGYYLEDENAVGFMKYYKNSEYAFVALLPNEGISVNDYIMSLSGAKLYALLSTPQTTAVDAAIPKFEAACDYELSDILIGMGMTDAFDWTKSDFSRLGSYEDLNIVMSRVLHKTFLAVTEMGTRAGAATVVEALAEGAAMDPKQVTLNRPFVYILMDTSTRTPFFIGTLMDVGT